MQPKGSQDPECLDGGCAVKAHADITKPFHVVAAVSLAVLSGRAYRTVGAAHLRARKVSLPSVLMPLMQDR